MGGFCPAKGDERGSARHEGQWSRAGTRPHVVLTQKVLSWELAVRTAVTQVLGPLSGQDPFPDSLYLPCIYINFPCGPGLKLENVPESSLWTPYECSIQKCTSQLESAYLGVETPIIWRTGGSGVGF